MSKRQRPNLFDFATKELSQDAVICWLIQWSDEQFANVDRDLHDCGRQFVSTLLHQHDATSPERISVKILQQDQGIDVLARVSQDHVLLIEDKTGSTDHSGQLKRYYDRLVSGRTKLRDVAKESVYPIYLKTGNQPKSKDRQIEQAQDGFHRPYRVFSRFEFLEVLRSYRGDHHALTDYRAYLERQEAETEGFRNWSRDSERWWPAWEGVYRHLEEELGNVAGWSYVANKAGGFLGLYWCFSRVDNGPHVYLQIEVEPDKFSDSGLVRGRRLLCFKVGEAPKERQSDLKWRWHRRLVKVGGESIEKPPVMRAGWTMTVARWKGDWLAFDGDGKVDLAGTVRNLKRAEEILRKAVALPD